MSKADALDFLLGQSSRSPRFVDIGARWGVESRWSALGGKASIIGFEPDAEECARLNASAPPNTRYVNTALAEIAGERELYLTVEPACSSLYPSIKTLYEEFVGLEVTRPAGMRRVACRRLDDALADLGVASVDAMKLDTQGSELSILRGATNALRTCSLIDVEVEFNPIYEGQALFFEIDEFLRCNGFVLWRLDNLVHYSAEPIAEARSEFKIVVAGEPPARVERGNGQLFWGQAYYVRADFPRTGIARLATDVAAVGALTVGLYGFWDLAFDIIRKTGDVALLANVQQRLAA